MSASSPGAHTPTSFARLFPDGAPPVAIAGVQVLRTMAAPEPSAPQPELSAEDSGDPPGTPQLRWSVDGLAAESHSTPLILIGDLYLRRGDVDAGATVAAHIAYRDSPDLHDEESVREQIEALGPWASELLYDIALGEVRRALASLGEHVDDLPLSPYSSD